jgi:hypothetical protein
MLARNGEMRNSLHTPTRFFRKPEGKKRLGGPRREYTNS